MGEEEQTIEAATADGLTLFISLEQPTYTIRNAVRQATISLGWDRDGWPNHWVCADALGAAPGAEPSLWTLWPSSSDFTPAAAWAVAFAWVHAGSVPPDARTAD